MKPYLEPGVLVKLFKREEGSDKMIEVVSRADRGALGRPTPRAGVSSR